MGRVIRYGLPIVLLCVFFFCQNTLAADAPKDKAAEVSIIGPDQVAVGARPIKLDIVGVTIAEILASDGKVILYPREGAEVWDAASWTGEPFLFFFGNKQGKYLVSIALAKEGKLVYAEHEITCGEGPNPPDPPDPPDPLPGTKYQVMFFHDKDKLDDYPTEQKEMLSSLAFREALEAKGHTFEGAFSRDDVVRTKQALDKFGKTTTITSVPKNLASWWEAVDGDTLPRFAIADINGGKIYDYDLPKTIAEFYKVLEGTKAVEVEQ